MTPAFAPGISTGGTARQIPGVSIVVTARNDDHGGNLLHRMQLFVDGLSQQCQRFQLPAELILVEWNPPADRAPLAQALNWPPGSPLKPRIITVPPAIHQRYRLAQRLPLYQMIAKNVGIRRASAPWVLATNIDILFSDGLMTGLAQGPHAYRLRPDFLCRADRWDVPAEVPPGGIAGQLAWCRSHAIRVHRRCHSTDLRTGTRHWVYWPLTPRVLLLEALQSLHLVPVVTRDRLHVNGCGDFTLLAKSAWERLRGYPELDVFSMHLDALLCHAAYRAGLREVVLPEPARVYHIEHAIGSGWSPEGNDQLNQRLAQAGINQISLAQYNAWAVQMRRERRPIPFNPPNWGLGDESLPET